MKLLLSYVCSAASVVLTIGILVAGLAAYNTKRLPDSAHLYLRDGLGRTLAEAPFVVQIAFGEDSYWAGWAWTLCDIGILLVAICMVIVLGGAGIGLRKSAPPQDLGSRLD